MNFQQDKKKEVPKIQLFIPCFVDQLFPDSAVNMLQILKEAGLEVEYNTNQTCCGQPAFNSGFWDEASTIAKKWISDMEKYDLTVVSPSSSCVGFVRNYYQDIFPENENCQRISAKTFEFTEYLVDVLGKTDFNARLEAKAVYHDSCAALRECRIKEAPRKLLANVDKLTLLELPDADQCCGFGGTFSIKYEPISAAMAEKKVQHALSVGAEIIISSDLSCLMQLEGYISKHKLPIKTMYIADVLICR
jgi:L-lactate dehydrogenase complex protein LldE